MTDATAMGELFRHAAETMLSSKHRKGSVVRLPGRGRLLVTGDLHDNPIHFQKVLKLARLEADPEHHLFLHELIHGENLINSMDFSHRMLAKVASLVLDFPEQVHPLLANHELAQLTGRGVSKGAGNSVVLFDQALEYVFQEAWESVAEAIDEFFRAMPLALISESGLMCAHSLPAKRALAKFDQEIVTRPLESEDYHYPDGSAYLMVWGRVHDQELYETLAKSWGVKLFCLGHQHVEMGIEIKGVDPGVLVLNSDHKRAIVLPLDLAAIPSPEEALMSALPLASLE